VTNVTRDESWVTTAEMMAYDDEQDHDYGANGADGSVFAARLHWNRPRRRV